LRRCGIAGVVVDLYASWGVDFIKADDLGSHL